MNSVPRTANRSGFTLLEVMMMGGLLLVVIIKASLVTSTILDVQSREGVAMDIEDKAQQVLDRIAYEIMSCDYDQLQPILEEPSDSSGVIYKFGLGLQDGKVVWSNPLEIMKDNSENVVYWKENAGLEGERQMVWSRWVSEYLEGETPNGLDDNGNGIADEKGLSFVLNGREVTIRLTLEHQMEDGETQLFTFERNVTCRN